MSIIELNSLLVRISTDYCTLRLFACACAREVLPKLSLDNHGRPRVINNLSNAIDASERYARGEGSIMTLQLIEDKMWNLYSSEQEVELAQMGIKSWGDVPRELPVNVIQYAAYAVMCTARWNRDEPGWGVRMAWDCAESVARCVGLLAAGKSSKAWSEAIVSVTAPGIVADTARDFARHIAAEAEADMRKWQVDTLIKMIEQPAQLI